MRAAGSEHAVLIGLVQGSAVCATFAAVHPKRTVALVL